MQIIANQAPIGFEAEFVNQRGSTILYRGILLPYSTDDEKIDFIYGVINWKELADQHTSDELLLQVDQALEARPEAAPHRVEDAPMTDWADGPGATPANDTDFDTEDAYEHEGGEENEVGVSGLSPLLGAGYGSVETEDEDVDEDGPIDYAAKYTLSYDDEDGEYDDEEDGDLPSPSFGSLTSIGGGIRKAERAPVLPEVPEADKSFPEIDLEDVQSDLNPFVDGDAGEDSAYAEPEGYAVPGSATDHDYGANGGMEETFAAVEEGVAFVQSEPLAVPADAGDAFADLGPDPLEEAAAPQVDPADMELGDWLASAREMAVAARTSEDRTRNALYEAIGRAYDFSLAADEKPEDFEELMEDAGLTMQERAPMTPVVKLVFGADYDKTRLTESAAALSHARRLELQRGTLGVYLRKSDGGLKGVVAAERRMRKVESGVAAEDPREALAEKLRALPAIGLAELDPSGAEFGLVMIRRSESGEIEIVGEVPEDVALLERAARKLVG
jgi:hypothetical protein